MGGPQASDGAEAAAEASERNPAKEPPYLFM